MCLRAPCERSKISPKRWWCYSEEAQEAAEPFPWKAVAVLALCNASHFYSICSLFSYAGFLCVDLGWSRNVDRAGFVAGWLGTALTLGRLPTAFAWGMAADKWGRKPCLMMSIASIGVGNLAFGLCRSLRAALVIRFVFLGMGNGWVSLVGTVTGEIAGRAKQNTVLAYTMSSGSLIQLVGPGVAAVVYGTGFRAYPALMPSLLGFGLACVTILLGVAWLPETKYNVDEDSLPPKQSDDTSALSRLCSNRSYVTGVVLRVFLGVVLFATFDVLPLWAIASLGSGGLALRKTQLAAVLTASAVAQTAFNVFGMPRCVKRTGQRRGLQLATLVGAVAIAATPLIGRAAIKAGFAVVLVCVTPCIMAFYSSASTSFTCISAIINNSVPSELRGSANGLAAFFEAFGKAAGPTLGATAFASSIAANPGTIGAGITFFTEAACLSIAAGVSLLLTPEVENSPTLILASTVDMDDVSPNCVEMIMEPTKSPLSKTRSDQEQTAVPIGSQPGDDDASALSPLNPESDDDPQPAASS